MKNDNVFMVGFIFSVLSDDCEITIYRGKRDIVTNTPKSKVSYRHYSRKYHSFWTNDGELIKDTKSVTIRVY